MRSITTLDQISLAADELRRFADLLDAAVKDARELGRDSLMLHCAYGLDRAIPQLSRFVTDAQTTVADERIALIMGTKSRAESEVERAKKRTESKQKQLPLD